VSAQPCLPGALSYIGCHFDSQGYLSDVAFYASSNAERQLACNSNDQQLSQTQLTNIVKSVGEVFTSMQICHDSGGVRGLQISTSLSQSYSCGQTSGSCSSLSGSGAALAGFGAVCGSAGALLRVQSITSPCWNRNYVQPTSPASEYRCVAAICQPALPQQTVQLRRSNACNEHGRLHSMLSIVLLQQQMMQHPCSKVAAM
jgi:hypothetical protein